VSINLWTLGLQAINVLILMWLLSRVFWKPLAAAIATRRDATMAMLKDAEDAQAKADAALQAVTKARKGIAAERAAVLAEAATKAEAVTKDALAAAHLQAEAVVKAAATTAEADATAAQTNAERASANLAVDIAQKLLAGLDTDVVQSAFLARLVAGIADMTQKDRATLATTQGGIDVVSPGDLTPDTQVAITKAIHSALGAKPELHFVTDPALIAGRELHTPHFTLHNSWRADLDDIQKGLTHVA